MKKRVVAYCRVSTDNEDQKNSFENQKSYFLRELRNNKNYEYCGIYADRGITGTTLEKRPDFNRMLTDAGLDIDNGYKIIAEPKFDLIMVMSTSRFARNVSVDVILKALAKNKVYVYFLDLKMSTENTNDISYIQFFLTVDERESRAKSERVSEGMKEGARDKKVILCTNKIYGYEYYPKPINKLKIIPEQAEVVRRMFEMYVDGIGPHKIARIFLDEGILNKSDEPFKEYSIRRILTNEKYCGIVARMKYDTGEVFNKHSYARIRPFEEREEFQFEDEDRMPAIISKELFYKAQKIKEGRIQHVTQKGKPRNKGVNYGTTPYAGKIKCGSCGTQYRAFQTKQYGDRKERYYCCVGKLDIDESRRCKNPNVSKTFLENELRSEKYTELLAESFLTAQRFYNKSSPADVEGKRNSHKYKDPDDIIRMEDAIPQIISKEDFARMQEIMLRRKKQFMGHKVIETYLLSGKIICGTCGGKYCGNRRKDGRNKNLIVRYCCNTRQRKGKAGCSGKDIRREYIEALVLDELARNIFDESLLPVIAEHFNEYHEQRNGGSRNEMDAAKKTIAKLDKDIDTLIILLTKTSSNALLSKLEQLEAEKAEAELTAMQLQTSLPVEVLDYQQIKAIFDGAKKMFAQSSLDGLQNLIDTFVERVVLYDDRAEIKFTFKKSSPPPLQKHMVTEKLVDCKQSPADNGKTPIIPLLSRSYNVSSAENTYWRGGDEGN